MGRFNHSLPLVKLADVEATRRVALIDFGAPGWAEPIAAEYNFEPARTRQDRIWYEDLTAFPALRAELLRRWPLSTFEATEWCRRQPEAEHATVAEQRMAIEALRFWFHLEVAERFLKDLVRRREVRA